MTEWTDEDRASWRSACTLESMRGWWAGSDCVVVGGGPSAIDRCHKIIASGGAGYMPTFNDHWTIGCNRACRFASPDFAACFEPRKDTDVWDVVIASSATFILSHIPRDHPRTILTPSKDDLRDTAKAPAHFGQCPFFAIACAIRLGFQTIGVIGLDLTEDRYPRTRRTTEWKTSEEAYHALAIYAVVHGSRLINLNPQTKLQAIPIGSWAEVRRK